MLRKGREAREEEGLCVSLQCGQSGEVRVGSAGGWAGTRWGRDLSIMLKTGHCHELTQEPMFRWKATGHPVFKGSGRVGFPPPPTAFLSSCHHPTAGPERWGSLRFLPLTFFPPTHPKSIHHTFQGYSTPAYFPPSPSLVRTIASLAWTPARSLTGFSSFHTCLSSPTLHMVARACFTNANCILSPSTWVKIC